MATIRNRTVLKIQKNMSILNTPVEEKNSFFLSSVYRIRKFNIFSQIKNKKNYIVDYVLKLISKNEQQNSAGRYCKTVKVIIIY